MFWSFVRSSCEPAFSVRRRSASALSLSAQEYVHAWAIKSKCSWHYFLSLGMRNNEKKTAKKVQPQHKEGRQ
eukprot:6195857-Pleurochrysis_carterae.AAC.4